MDEPRLLHKRPELGYTTRPHEAANGEPEAVSAREQAELTDAAHGRADRDRRELWLELRRRLESTLEDLRSSFGPRVSNEVRGVRRELDRMDSKLR